MGIIFNHKILDSGEMELTDFRFIDNGQDPPAAVCELDGEELRWNIEPNNFLRKFVENEFMVLKREIFYNNRMIRLRNNPETKQSTWKKYEPKTSSKHNEDNGDNHS